MRTKSITLFAPAPEKSWHSFVRKMLDAGMPGLENPRYIPGTVGAA